MENGTFAFSNSIFPLTSSTSNSSLFDIDKPLYYLLDFNAGVLDIYDGYRFVNEAIRANRSDLNQIVAYKLPYNPVPYLTDTTIKFPLLAMWRGDGRMGKMESISYYRVVSEVHLLYLLPPLTATQREYLQPTLTGMMATIKDRNESGWDPHYLNGTKVGALAGYEVLNCKSYEITEFPGVKSELPFVALYMSFEMWEIPGKVPNEYEAATGLDGYINLEADPDIDNFVVIDSDAQPTNPEGSQQ